MAANEIFSHLKSAIKEFYDFETKDVRATNSRGKTLSEDRRIILKDLIDLALNTSATNLETKVYLSNYYLSSGEVYKFLEEKTQKTYNKKTTMNKIDYCKKKFAEELGRDAIVKIVDYTTNDISEYVKKIQEMRLKYGEFNCFDNYILDLSDIPPSLEQVSEERIVDTLASLESFKKENVNILKNSLDKEAVSYIKYISSSVGLTERDRELKALIKGIIEGEEE